MPQNCSFSLLFHFGFSTSKSCLFRLNSFYTVENPNQPLKFSANVSVSVLHALRPDVPELTAYANCTAVCCCCCCCFFLHTGAKIILNMRFSTLLKISHTIGKKEEEQKKQESRDLQGPSPRYSSLVTLPVSYPARHGLT